ncbi:hypothetical protein PVL29_007045 [Vitis rotundifolia]|uniref:P-type ATPase A domain-containing protein n=1 Tax=Vitis rotundifolia TaxID=103349 RepID=A0AA39DW65_VITRO|nr:hypothetical protein PVL29_007045 [Vitis rotundifolia]
MARLVLKVKISRDGKWIEKHASILAPGGVIGIKLGDIIPVDVCLFGGDFLKIGQFALMGESFLLTKYSGVGVHSSSACNSSIKDGSSADLSSMDPENHESCKQKQIFVQVEVTPSDGIQGAYEELYLHISAKTSEKVDAAVALIELLATPVSGNPAAVSTTPITMFISFHTPTYRLSHSLTSLLTITTAYISPSIIPTYSHPSMPSTHFPLHHALTIHPNHPPFIPSVLYVH